MNPYEIVGVTFGVVAVWLTTRQNVWCWPTGLVNVGLFIIVFGEARLYADMGLQVVYVVLCAYGWYEWLRGGPGHGRLAVSHGHPPVLGALAALGAAGALAVGFLLHRHTDASLPWVDASTTSYSLVAQWMQTRKWIENWVLWMVVDVVYIWMYISKGLLLTAGLYAIFLVLAVVGFVEWRRSLIRQARPS